MHKILKNKGIIKVKLKIKNRRSRTHPAHRTEKAEITFISSQSEDSVSRKGRHGTLPKDAFSIALPVESPVQHREQCAVTCGWVNQTSFETNEADCEGGQDTEASSTPVVTGSPFTKDAGHRQARGSGS